MSRKVLIISPFSFPLNAISSYRTEAYMKHLPGLGYIPTLVTTDWHGAHKQAGPEGKIDQTNRILIKPADTDTAVKVRSKTGILKDWAKGKLDPGIREEESYHLYRDQLFNLADIKQYDVILGLFSPYFVVKLCFELHKEFGIPYVLDFRDLHDNKVLSNRSIDFKTRIRNFFAKRYLRKWMKHAVFVTTVSRLWADYLAKLGRVKGFVVLNGYEKEFLEGIRAEPDTDFFNITSAGNLKDDQDLHMLYGALQSLYTSEPELKIKVNFIGVTDFYRGNVKEELRNNVPAEWLVLTDKLPKKEAIRRMKRSHMLLFPVTVGYRGYYTGKIFEYLGINRKIIAFPGDNDVIDKLLEKTDSGISLNKQEEIASFILKNYKLWAEGNYTFGSRSAEVEYYDREVQVKRMAALLDKHIQHDGRSS